MADPRQRRGRLGEAAAAAALEARGYRIVEQNYRCRAGELDIVAEHDGTLCFVEVRARRHGALVDGRSSVDARKRRKLVRVAQVYCRHRGVGERAMRFDVVDVQLQGDSAPQVEIIRNAFDATGNPG